MNNIQHQTLGEAWLAVVREVYRRGEIVGDETRELLNVCTAFHAADFASDPILQRFGSVSLIDEMRKVFFSTKPNQLGHSYADKLYGPRGRQDLSDVIELLSREPWSKRGVVSLQGAGDGRVPCINTIHFLRREGGLVANYFARGQDVFRKYYADGICLYELALRVSDGIGIPLLLVSGFLSSAHTYLKDCNQIETLLADTQAVRKPARILQEAWA